MAVITNATGLPEASATALTDEMVPGAPIRSQFVAASKRHSEWSCPMTNTVANGLPPTACMLYTASGAAGLRATLPATVATPRPGPGPGP